ncbi:MAG TPA: glycosyl hydrolase 53 family protein [Tepidisphaeraceae bacterium]|nr:glycosyl hydrolase 53 family protein [Tepidisphaeraceae bacterium]
MSKARGIGVAGAIVLLVVGSVMAQTPTTQPGRGRGRGFGRPPATTPDMLQDQQTGQWYTPMARHADYAFGADLSSDKQLEEGGKKFKDTDGQVKPVFQIFRNHGYNWMRVRTCVPPVRLPQDAAYTVAVIQDAKKLGFKTLVDFHYSNSWADPTNEPTPSTWQAMSPKEMATALFEYTRDTVAEMAKADALPDMIQVGNEVSNGFLWPTAKLPENWDNFANLIYAGVNGIDAGRGNNKRPLIMIHVDHGGDLVKTKAFFDKFNTYNIPYDTIGFSFYPWSHGTLVDLKANFAFAATTYGKDVYLVETGYYYAPSRYFSAQPGPFPETPEGQAQWLDEVNRIVMDTPNGRGKGVFWWEPAGGQGLMQRGYFDPEGTPQPILNVFHKYALPTHRTDNQ